jgi:hypothetical protein
VASFFFANNMMMLQQVILHSFIQNRVAVNLTMDVVCSKFKFVFNFAVWLLTATIFLSKETEVSRNKTNIEGSHSRA